MLLRLLADLSARQVSIAVLPFINLTSEAAQRFLGERPHGGTDVRLITRFTVARYFANVGCRS